MTQSVPIIMKNRLKMAMAAAEILYSEERKETKEKRKEMGTEVRKSEKEKKRDRGKRDSKEKND